MHNKLTNYQQDIKYSMGNSFLLLCINGDAWKDFIKTPAFLYEVMMGFLILHFFLFWMPSRDHQKANHIYAVTRETGAIMFVVVDVVVNIATSIFVDDPTAFLLLLIRKWIPHNHNNPQLILSSSWRKHPKIIISYVLFPLIHKISFSWCIFTLIYALAICLEGFHIIHFMP